MTTAFVKKNRKILLNFWDDTEICFSLTMETKISSYGICPYLFATMVLA